MPARTPLEVRFKPVPARPVDDQLSGAVPPVSTTGCAYEVLNPAFGKVCAGICGAGLMVMETADEAVIPPLSVTWAVNEVVPTAVGVPLMTPAVEFRFNPGGSEPAVMDQLA